MHRGIQSGTYNPTMSVPCNPFFLKYFRECLRTVRDYCGFSVSMISISVWIVAQAPQLYTNYKNQTVEALSPWFLAQWLLGDTGNILGCLLTGDQQPTTTYTAMYFVVIDILLMMQYIYYGTLHRRRERVYTLTAQAHHQRRSHSSHQHRHHRHRHKADPEQGQLDAERGSTSVRGVGVVAPAAALLGVGAVTTVMSTLIVPGMHRSPSGRMLNGLSYHIGWAAAPRPEWSKTAGQVCGYASSVLYVTSRIPQLYKNWKRKSVEGLALAMFFCACLANLTYGAGILVRTKTLPALLPQLPWIIGSLGTVFFDCCIMVQFVIYHKGPKLAVTEALLHSA